MKRTEIRRMSKKRQAEQRKRRALIRRYGEPQCFVRWDWNCRGMADDLHEPLLRSRGGDPTSEEQTVPTCRPCHDNIHQHPAEATERGWMIHSWEA